MRQRERNEDKRTILWWVITLLALAVVLCVAAFFVVHLRKSNPLTGTWVSQDAAISLQFSDDGTAVVLSTENEMYEAELTYTYDKTEKTVDIRLRDPSGSRTDDASDTAEQALRDTFGLVTDSFNYNIKADTLTLTEREFGEQLVFARK